MSTPRHGRLPAGRRRTVGARHRLLLLCWLPTVLSVTGCGSEAASPEDLARQLKCEGFAADPEEDFASAGGTCMLDGVGVALYTFPDRSAQTQWIDAARSVGATTLLVGSDFVVHSEHRPVLETAAERLGGDLRD